ncbi:dynein regulatory complex subunit 2 [Drosophila navojoa]|nr:dynein regulatory complex subunit 2 [Drosophila navojoa]
MGKKGKGKGNKLAKMSEEERARYLQMRADMEEETRRRKMQLIAMYMKNKLKREDAFCRLNMAKINQEWRSILRQVKIQDLRREILDVAQFFEQALKRKDQVIQRLIGDINSTEDMYANLQQSHMENIDHIIGIHRSRIEFFWRIYEDDKQAVLREYKQDAAIYKDLQAEKQQQLECVFYQLEETSDRAIKDNHEAYLDRVEDLKSGMQLKLEKITGRGEGKLEALWQEYQSVLADYGKHIEGFYSEYVDLKQRDEESAQQISQQNYEIEYLTEQLCNLRLLAEEQQIKQQAQLHQRQNIKEELTDRLRELRSYVEKEAEEQHRLFKQMTVESYEAIQTLKAHLSKVETLSQLSRICSKMETQREKLFQLPQLSKEIIEIREQQTPGEDDADLANDPLKEEVAALPQMETFWRRVNNVSVDVACLKQQKRNLEAENAKLKAELQEYLIDLNIANGSNSHIHDYLSRRPKSMSVDRVTQLRLQPKQVKSAVAGGRRPAPRPIGAHVPSCEASMSNLIRSRNLVRGKPQLAKLGA